MAVVLLLAWISRRDHYAEITDEHMQQMAADEQALIEELKAKVDQEKKIGVEAGHPLFKTEAGFQLDYARERLRKIEAMMKRDGQSKNMGGATIAAWVSAIASCCACFIALRANYKSNKASDIAKEANDLAKHSAEVAKMQIEQLHKESDRVRDQ